MHSALVRSGMPLVNVPRAVFERLRDAAMQFDRSLQIADPRLVRSWLLEGTKTNRQASLTQLEGIELLRHCVRDFATPGGVQAHQLRGLHLIPLAGGGLGLIRDGISHDYLSNIYLIWNKS